MPVGPTIDPGGENGGSGAPHEVVSWRPSRRAFAVAVLLGAAGGALAALFLTVMEAAGIVS